VNADLASQLSREYEYYWRHELEPLPDQWASTLVDFWTELEGINNAVRMIPDRRIIWVALRYHVYPCGVTAYASPIAQIERWSPDHAMALIMALDTFHKRISETCEECGSRKGFRHKTQLGLGGDDRILCHECGEKWQDKIHGQ
jgi:hypothetical protein